MAGCFAFQIFRLNPNFFSEFLLIVFQCGCDKTPYKGNETEEMGLFWLTIYHDEESWHWEHEAASHTVSLVRKQRGRCCFCADYPFFIQSGNPACGNALLPFRMFLLASVNLLEKLPRKTTLCLLSISRRCGQIPSINHQCDNEGRN